MDLFFEWVLNITLLFILFDIAEPSQENLTASPQPLRQTPPVQQAQNVYNGLSQGTLNQHNPYSGVQIAQGMNLYYKLYKLVKVYY